MGALDGGVDVGLVLVGVGVELVGAVRDGLGELVGDLVDDQAPGLRAVPDVRVVQGVALVVVLLWKEFALRTFDPAQAEVTGLPTRAIDTALFACIVVATVIGVKAVGLVLMVAFVVTPPATARQWTNRLSTTVILAGAVGGLGSAVGSYLSIALGDVPTGPLIVLVLFAFFLVSLLCAPHRGLIARGVGRARARRRLLAEVAA